MVTNPTLLELEQPELLRPALRGVLGKSSHILPWSANTLMLAFVRKGTPSTPARGKALGVGNINILNNIK